VIKAAYKRLAVKYHPDTGGINASNEMMQMLNEAHRVLTDPHSRAQYDRLRLQGQTPASKRDQTANPTAHRRILKCDFTTSPTQWIENDTEESRYFRRDSFYHMGVKKSSWEVYSCPSVNIKNFEAAFSAQFVRWGSQSAYG